MSCPICKKDTDPKYRPFCSKRCADVDLAHWFSGQYSVPSQRLDEDDPDTQEPVDTAKDRLH